MASRKKHKTTKKGAARFRYRWGIRDIEGYRERCRNDFWFFARTVLQNDGYDPFFHKLLSQVAMHGESIELEEGDYFFPDRASLKEARGILTYANRIDNGELEGLAKRLKAKPTAMDGSFRGIFVRIVRSEKCDLKQVMVPRGHLKTTFLTVAYNVWLLIRNPSETILVTMNTKPNARNVIAEMKGFFERNELFRDVFGYLVPGFLAEDTGNVRARRKVELLWQAEKFEIPIPAEKGTDARRFVGRREPTVTGYGVGGRLTSLHATRLHFDDLVDEKVVKTGEGLEQNIKDFQQLQSMGVGDSTKQFYVGTPWHYGDLSQWLLDPSRSGFETSTVVIATAIGADGGVFFKKESKRGLRGEHPGFTKAVLKARKKRTESSGLFSSQYLMQPVETSAQNFQAKWWKFYAKMPTDRAYVTVMTVDPAISETVQGDHSAFVVVSMDDIGRWFIRDVVRHRCLGVPGIVETVYGLWNDYRAMGGWNLIDAIGIESIGFQRTLLTIFQDLWSTKGREQLPIIPVEPSRKASKEWRIKRIAPRVKTGRVFLPAPLPDEPLTMEYQRGSLPDGLAALVVEGERFPRARYDDCIDALSMVADLPFYPPTPEKKKVETLVERVRRGRRQRIQPGDVDPILGRIW